MKLSADERLGEGGFAEVFALDAQRCAKVARAAARTQGGDALALAQVTGSFIAVNRAPSDVLAQQYEMLRARRDLDGWVQVESLDEAVIGGRQALVMVMQRARGRALLPGDSPALVAKVARAVARAPHYDLKPEHVFVDGEHITLIDPGLVDERGLITTPAFNPYMEGNDLAGLGLLLYWVVSGMNPLLHVATHPTPVSAGWRHFVRQFENAGTGVDFGRLLQLPPMSVGPPSSRQGRGAALLEAVALRALAARRDPAGVLHAEAPFASPTAFADALEGAI